jgi:ribosomal protein S18 acetylase RimI-like enzyme
MGSTDRLQPTDGVIGIRPARTSDEPVLVALAERLTAFPLPPWRKAEDIAVADAREMMAAVRAGEPDNHVVIAERAGVPIGCLHVLAMTDFFGTRHAHISVIATTAAAAGSGVGRALLEYGEGWARGRGLTLLTLNVFAGNARARRFYERAGWSAEMMKYTKPLTP